MAPPSPPNSATSSMTRDMNLARDAFKLGDSALSRAAHTYPKTPSECSEAGHEGKMSPMRQCLVWGAMEGFLSSVAVLSLLSCDRSMDLRHALTLSTCLVAGLTLVFGARDTIRIHSQLASFDHERKREMWEMRNFAEGERKEMVELFVDGGVSEPDARKAVELLSRPQYEEFFVDLMMVKELNMEIPDRTKPPLVLGVATAAISFVAGMVPIVGYHTATALGLVEASLGFPHLLFVVAGSLFVVLVVLSLLRVELLPATSHRTVFMMYGSLFVLAACANLGMPMLAEVAGLQSAAPTTSL